MFFLRTRRTPSVGVPPAQQTNELTENEFRARRDSCDDYQGELLARFRIGRTKEPMSGPQIPYHVSEPGFLMLTAALAAHCGPARILDFGGGAGHAGIMLRATMPRQVQRYTVVELPKFVEVACGAEIPGIEFVSSAPTNEPFDIVFSSGALQYTVDPLSQLESLVSIGAQYMVLTRNFFAPAPRYFEQLAPLFNHGEGPIPEEFSNHQTTTYVQALPLERVRIMLSGRYDTVLSINNETGLAQRGEGLVGMDLLCRRR